MIANAIASNFFNKVNKDGQHFVLFNNIIYLLIDGTQIKERDCNIHMSNRNKRKIETTK